MSKSSDVDFSSIHNAFQNESTDLCKLQNREGFSRYILIRTLDDKQLTALYNSHHPEQSSNKTEVSYNTIFDSLITIEQLKEYISKTYPSVSVERKKSEEYLPGIIEEFKKVRCGVRSDNLNNVAKKLVRNKSIINFKELQDRLTETGATVKAYLEWQYFNQATNDLIEHFVNDHKKVIPTLRKITYLDFILDIESKEIPFDLKITHVSDEYFKLLAKGLEVNPGNHDDFKIGTAETEIQTIKKFYKSHKKKYKLPSFGKLNKVELLNLLEKNIPSDEFAAFKTSVLKKRSELIEHTQNNLHKLEWWNYKFQGERLFKNNNRFFVFLVYDNSLEDASPLKSKIDTIGKEITKKLDSLSLKSLNEINYKYEKKESLNGNYTATSFSILIRAKI